MVPSTQAAHKLKDYYGIYIVAFETPEPTLYIGIATDDTKMSEVVLNRFKNIVSKLQEATLEQRQPALVVSITQKSGVILLNRDLQR